MSSYAPSTGTTFGFPLVPGGGIPGPRKVGAPASLPITDLDRKHPDYQEFEPTWKEIRLLNEGGQRLMQNAHVFLEKRPKELDEVYQARLRRFVYQDIMGSGIDYYLAAIFSTDPELDANTVGPDGARTSAELDEQQKYYWDLFKRNCDRRQTSYVDSFRMVLRNILLYQSAWILTDLPMPKTTPLTLAEQQIRGDLDPYIVVYEPQEVYNWCEDDFGVLEWVVIHCKSVQQQFAKPPITVKRWYYYDRFEFRIYQETSSQSSPMQADKSAILIAQGRHAFSEYETVPVLQVAVPTGMWLANRVMPQVKSHINNENAYDWSLQQSNLAMPVLTGNIREVPTISAGGYIQLPEGATISWTEPPGGAYERSEIRINTLREEIYRQMFLLAQSRSNQDTPTMQSGISKEMDMVPATHIQNFLGDLLRVNMQKVMNNIARFRQDAIEWDVRGFQFISNPAELEMNRGQQFLGLMVPSVTAEKENFKICARARFRDINTEKMQLIEEEIDAAPTMEEKAAMEEEKQREGYQQQLETEMVVKKAGEPEPPKGKEE